MDAVQLLTADHNRFRGAITRFKAAKDAGDVRDMGRIVNDLFADLRVHSAIEEEVFYPTVRHMSDDIGELVDEGVEEHHVVDVLMDEVAGLEAGSDEWSAKVTVLIENLEHHAGEEESDLFPKVRGAMGAPALGALADRLERAKADMGAPTMDDKAHMTVHELADLAREQQIPGRSSMDKDELAATVAPG